MPKSKRPRPTRVTQDMVDRAYNRSLLWLIFGALLILTGSGFAVVTSWVIAFLYSRVAVMGENMMKGDRHE